MYCPECGGDHIESQFYIRATIDVAAYPPDFDYCFTDNMVAHWPQSHDEILNSIEWSCENVGNLEFHCKDCDREFSWDEYINKYDTGEK